MSYDQSPHACQPDGANRARTFVSYNRFMTGRTKQPKPRRTAEVWTTRRLLKWMADYFESKAVDSPRVVGEMLLAHVLGCERMRLYMESDRPASPPELTQLRDLVARAAELEPVQYLVGGAWFFGKAFKVDRSTLIPRPCTEMLVEHVIRWLRVTPGHSQPLIADIGTGTGCIAISIAAQFPEARLIATDVIPEALELARANAATHKVIDRIDFRLGPGIDALRNQVVAPARQSTTVNQQLSTNSSLATRNSSFDVICSNPPYVPDHEWETKVERNVKEYEPASALRVVGGRGDGLDVIGQLISEAPEFLKPGGLLAIEIAACQRDAVMEMARRRGALENIEVLKDHEGLWRVLTAERAR
jgi:release factor glutamine methyltransferase